MTRPHLMYSYGVSWILSFSLKQIMPTTWLPPPQFLDISTPLHSNVILVNTKIPLKLNVSQPYNKKFCDFIRFLFCFCRSVLVLGRNSFVWKPNVRTDPTLLYGAICLSTKSLCQNGSREGNAQVYHLPNFAIGHFMRLWIQSMAICKDDLSYSPFYIFTHQTQVDSTISRKEVPRCSWWWRLNHILSFYLQHVLDWLNAIKMIFHVSMLSTIPTWNCLTIILV